MKKLTMTKHNHLTKSASKPIPKPTKAPVPAKAEPIKPKPVTPIKVNTKPKVKAQSPKTTAKVHKAIAKPQQTQPKQTPQLQISDFKLQTSVDNIGIHITTMYLGNAIHRFTLPVAEYGKWQSMTAQHKHMYVQARTFVNAFGNDLMIIQTVIQSTIQVLNNLFAKAQAQQQQAQREKMR